MKNLLKNKLFCCFLCWFSFIVLYGQNIRPVEYWEKIFVQDLDKNLDIDFRLSMSNDSWSFYKLAGPLDAYTAMYRCTSNPYYLDIALLLINNVINTSNPSYKIKTSQFNDYYLSWANHSHEEKKNDGKEYPLYETFFWRYVTEVLRVMKENSLDVSDNYEQTYSNILNFTITNIFKKWESRGRDNIYRISTETFVHWAIISLDLWVLTKDELYKPVFEEFNSRMRRQLKSHPKIRNGYFWDQYWDKVYVKTNKGQDVSHSNMVVMYMIRSYEDNVEFTKNDIRKLISTFNTIWRQDGSCAYYLDGSGNGAGRFVDGFLKLGRFDLNLQKRIDKYVFTKESIYYRKSQFIANAALNSWYLNKEKK